ncbi:MAG: four helix bundle protein [Pirellulales bacterium]
MNEADLKQRTKEFALRIMKMAKALPKDIAGEVVAKQIMRAATSVAANYRSACRAKSKKDFVAKLGIVEEEADETLFWLEIIADSEMLSATRVQLLLGEADELVRIVTASRKTASQRLNQ